MRENEVPRYMRAVNEEQAEEFRARTAAGAYDLISSETWWKDRNQILEDRGYQLRSRLRPGWIPSWQDTDINPQWCEDRIAGCVSSSRYSCILQLRLTCLQTQKVVDAVRKSDGKDVAVMNLRKVSRERQILQYVMDLQQTGGERSSHRPRS